MTLMPRRSEKKKSVCKSLGRKNVDIRLVYGKIWRTFPKVTHLAHPFTLYNHLFLDFCLFSPLLVFQTTFVLGDFHLDQFGCEQFLL